MRLSRKAVSWPGPPFKKGLRIVLSFSEIFSADDHGAACCKPWVVSSSASLGVGRKLTNCYIQDQIPLVRLESACRRVSEVACASRQILADNCEFKVLLAREAVLNIRFSEDMNSKSLIPFQQQLCLTNGALSIGGLNLAFDIAMPLWLVALANTRASILTRVWFFAQRLFVFD